MATGVCERHTQPKQLQGQVLCKWNDEKLNDDEIVQHKKNHQIDR